MNNIKKIVCWDKVFLWTVVSLAFPIFLQSLVSQSLALIDNLMVSKLKDITYAGVSQANRFTMIPYVMLFGVSTGSGVFMSQYWGAKQIDNMKKSLGMCLMVGVSLATIITLAIFLFNSQIMSLFLRPGKSLEEGRKYLVTVAPIFPIAAITNAYATLMRSEEKTKYPMIAATVSVVSNTILNYLLIEGHFGFPRLEVIGAAIATVISQTICLLIVIYFYKKKSIAGNAKISELFSVGRDFVFKFLKTCWPVIANEILWSTGTAVYAIFYGMRGDKSVAAVSVFNNIDGISFILLYSFVSVTSILVGKELGAGNKENALLYAKRLSFGITVCSMIIGFMVILMINPLLSIFGSLSEETLFYARKLIIISLIFIFVRAFNSTLVVGILRAGGDTLVSLILDVTFIWGVVVPIMAYAAIYTNLSIEYLFMISLIDEVLKFGFGMKRFLSGKWLKNLTT